MVWSKLAEFGLDEVCDFVFTVVLACGTKLAKLLDDLVVFEMGAEDVVIVAAAFDDGGVDDVVGGSAEGIAHIGLLEDFFETRAGAAVGDELIGSEAGALDAVDDVEQAEFDGVSEGDAVIQIPGGICRRWERGERREGIFEF